MTALLVCMFLIGVPVFRRLVRADAVERAEARLCEQVEAYLAGRGA